MTPDNRAPAAEVVGGCYRIVTELGHGGMARVYRAVDERSGQVVALKRLVGAAKHRASAQAMFEREYHTLVQLAHPHIVRAFDYGVDGDRPYYTMELLAGCDAREATRDKTLGVREACMLLRDAASALALIHSRRMVHRDVSLRNLWCLPDGRAKLIDFGTLVAMGPQTRVAGTPPFVPPEAVYMQPLDARCDLYGLGALAYCLLTQRNAYPAREVGDLRQLWQHRPKSPDALRPDVPRALSELIMTLLSIDPRGRPASAAEVFERLSAIGELPPEDERHIAQAFLASPKLIGRDEPSALFRKQLQRARRKRGGVLAVVAPAGLGRSRMLASFVLEAKLMGAAVVSVDASATGSEAFGVAGALAESLLEILPLAAADVSALAGVLGHISPMLHKALGEPALAELKPFEHVRRLSSAVASLVEAASRLHPVMIAVDDVHRADGASLGALGAIAELGERHNVLLVTSCDASALHAAPPVLEELTRAGQRIELAPLRPEDTRELLGSLFGAIPGLDAAAAWLHDLSQGSPQACMQYAQYLVDHGIARLEGGRWKLPPDLREQALPATLGAMLEARLAALSADARALALGLALAHDETRSIWQPENHVRLEDYPKLLGPTGEAFAASGAAPAGGDAARAFFALDELLRAGLVEQRDASYVLAQGALSDALLRVSDAAEQAVMHERLARILDQPAYQGRLLAVRQMQRAGQHGRARELLSRFTDQLGAQGAAMNWGAMRVSLSAACGRNALAHWQREGGSVREGIVLRRLVVMTASVYDWSSAQIGDAQIAQLRADSGLVHWDETDPALPPLQRVAACLTRAQETYDRTPEAARGFAPGDAVRELASCVMTMLGALVHAHDVTRVRALPKVLEPLRSLSPLTDLIWRLCELGVDRVLGRELGDRIAELGVYQLFEQTTLPEVLRIGGAGVNAHLQAMEDARRGRRRAIDIVELLVPYAGEEMYLVIHARWLGHAFRGESALAESFRKRVEVITEDDVWRRKATLFIEAELYALTGDLLRLGRTCEAIAEVARSFAGWRPWLSWARAAMHRLRGEYEAAASELEAALADAPAGEHRAWLRAAPARAELLLLRGDHAAALREADAVAATVRAQGLDLTAEVAAERVRALAESGLGRHDDARASLSRMFALANRIGYGGLPLALLHDAQARVAFAAGRNDECATALVALRTLLERADAPALIHTYETTRAQIRQLAIPELPTASGGSPSMHPDLSDVSTQVLVRMSSLSERGERAQQALKLLLEDTGADIGHLFLFDADGMFAAASIGDDSSRDELLTLAQKHVDAERDRADTDVATVTVESAGASIPPTLTTVGSQLSPVLLMSGSNADDLTGLALLGTRRATLRMPRRELLRELSRCLQSTGDSVPLALGR